MRYGYRNNTGNIVLYSDRCEVNGYRHSTVDTVNVYTPRAIALYTSDLLTFAGRERAALVLSS